MAETDHQLGRELKVWQLRFFKLATLLALVTVGWILMELAKVFGDILAGCGFGILIAYLLSGYVNWLQTKVRVRNRVGAVMVAYLSVGALLTLFITFVVPPLTEQLQQLATQMPQFFTKLEEWLLELSSRVPEFSLADWTNIFDQLSSFLSSALQQAAGSLVQYAFSTINLVIYTIFTLFFSAYLLIDSRNIWNSLLRYLSRHQQVHMVRLRNALDRSLHGFLVGQVKLALVSGAVVFGMYALLGSKYALLLTAWQSIIEIVPVIGGFLGILLGVIVLLFNSPWKAVTAFIVYMFYTQVIKDNFLTPRIMSGAIGLHPIVVLVVVLIGARVGGLIGIVFALPVAGVLNVSLSYYLSHRHKSASSGQDHDGQQELAELPI